MVEFTGERVVPGEVDPDLWNEHVARYAFAARMAAGARVLDAGCGTGYGSALLARSARAVIGLDISADAVHYARAHYPAGNVTFLQALCAALPVAGGSIDLLVAFEVIEHLPDWKEFLQETRRVLAPGGRLVISTPNTDYYAESRRCTGPNPFHVHEFGFEEFAGELHACFPQVALYLQNHIEGIGFQPLGCGGAAPELARDPDRHPGGEAAHAHFYVAVCALQEQPVPSPFLYLPAMANVLRERERHIDALEGWLKELRQEKQLLVEMFRTQEEALQRSNTWAGELDEKLRSAQDRIVALQDEVARLTAGYEARVSELERDTETKTLWALDLQSQLEARGRELVDCVRLLDAAEKTVEERTQWALDTQARLDEAQSRLAMLRASRLFRLVRAIGLVPRFPAD